MWTEELIPCNVPSFFSLSPSSGAFYPLQIGDNVIVGEDTIINASSVGSYVHVGKNCVIVSSSYTIERECEGFSKCK